MLQNDHYETIQSEYQKCAIVYIIRLQIIKCRETRGFSAQKIPHRLHNFAEIRAFGRSFRNVQLINRLNVSIVNRGLIRRLLNVNK